MESIIQSKKFDLNRHHRYASFITGGLGFLGAKLAIDQFLNYRASELKHFSPEQKINHYGRVIIFDILGPNKDKRDYLLNTAFWYWIEKYFKVNDAIIPEIDHDKDTDPIYTIELELANSQSNREEPLTASILEAIPAWGKKLKIQVVNLDEREPAWDTDIVIAHCNLGSDLSTMSNWYRMLHSPRSASFGLNGTNNENRVSRKSTDSLSKNPNEASSKPAMTSDDQDIILDFWHFAGPVGVMLHENPDMNLQLYANAINKNVYTQLKEIHNYMVSREIHHTPIRTYFASTSEIYGELEAGDPKVIDLNVFNDSRRDYVIQKISGENLFGNASFLDTTIFRFFNVFGPGQDPSKGAVSKIIREAQKSKGESMVSAAFNLIKKNNEQDTGTEVIQVDDKIVLEKERSTNTTDNTKTNYQILKSPRLSTSDIPIVYYTKDSSRPYTPLVEAINCIRDYHYNTNQFKVCLLNSTDQEEVFNDEFYDEYNEDGFKQRKIINVGSSMYQFTAKELATRLIKDELHTDSPDINTQQVKLASIITIPSLCKKLLTKNTNYKYLDFTKKAELLSSCGVDEDSFRTSREVLLIGINKPDEISHRTIDPRYAAVTVTNSWQLDRVDNPDVTWYEAVKQTKDWINWLNRRPMTLQRATKDITHKDIN